MSSPNGLYKFTLASIKRRHAEAKNLPIAQSATTSRKLTMDKKLDEILVNEAERIRDAGEF
jgi:hypothetical protein